MTEKELKKLSRAELPELLLMQTRISEQLQKQLDAAQAELRERQLQIRQSGNLAQAVLKINGVMEAAQAAADQYLENIARMEQETRLRCEQLLAQTTAEAGQPEAAVPPETTADDAGSQQALYSELSQLLTETDDPPGENP